MRSARAVLPLSWWPLGRLGSALCLGATLASARDAFAAESRFEWHAPAACPDEARVYAALGELLGPAPLDFGSFRSIRADVKKRGNEWELVLDLVDSERRRSRVIRAPQCADLLDAASVAIAIAVHEDVAPSGRLASSEHDVESAPSGQAAVASSTAVGATRDTPEPPLPDAKTSDPPSPTRVRLHAAGVMDGAALPGTALGVSLGAALLRGPWEVGPYVLFLPGRERTTGAVARVQFSLLAGGLRACHRLSSVPVATRACAGVEAGRLQTSSEGLVGANQYSDWWVAPSAGLDFVFSLGGRWSLEARGDALVPLVRESYVVNQTEPVFRPPSVGLRAALGVSLALD